MHARAYRILLAYNLHSAPVHNLSEDHEGQSISKCATTDDYFFFPEAC